MRPKALRELSDAKQLSAEQIGRISSTIPGTDRPGDAAIEVYLEDLQPPMRKFPEYQICEDPYIGTQAISVSLLRALLRVAYGSALFDCVAGKVGATIGDDLGKGEGQQQ